MDILYTDEDIVVCIKPPRVLSTDEPGGLPELVRQALGTDDIRTVHRLDRVVSGVMVLARNAAAASELSRQIREDQFQKEYLAVIHGVPQQRSGTWEDLLYRDKARRITRSLARKMAFPGWRYTFTPAEPTRSGCSFPAVVTLWWGNGSMRCWKTPVKLPCGPTALALPGWPARSL